MNEPHKNTEAAARVHAAEPDLFVVWANARHLQDDILAELGRRFRISGVRELYWTRQLVTANFQRFYSDLDLRGVYHRLNKGAGPFLAISGVGVRHYDDEFLSHFLDSPAVRLSPTAN